MSKEIFQYKLVFRYVDSESNDEINIDAEQIQYVAIDKNYEETNMPVIAIIGSIEKNVLDEMILNIDKNIVNLGIYRYDVSNQSDGITKKYFQDRFIYIIPDDISKTAEIDYPNGEDKPGLYKDVTIWLLPQDAVNNNRRVINGVFKNASMNSLILNITTTYLGKVLLEPLKYDNKFDQVVIPPQDSISSYITFLNNNLSVFYDTDYRFFIDFDMTYILSSEGNIVKSKNQDIFTVEINVKDIIADSDDDPGMYVDQTNNKYIMYVNSSQVEYTKNNISNKIVNKVTTIDTSGNVQEKILASNQTGITKTMNQIINLDNDDSNAINTIASNIESGNIRISIIKNDLDASMFTINKEYIINDPLHSEYNGRYLLVSTKQFFVKQSEYFVMSTVLNFKKI